MLNYDDIKNEYDYIRQKNLLLYEEKKEKLYEKYPKLKELDFKIISIYVKKCAENSDTYLDTELKSFKEEKEKFLKDNGIKDDYLEVHYNCEKCRDTGYVDGKKCSCHIAKIISMFNNISNINEIIKTDNFDNLDESYFNQSGVMTQDGKRTYKDYMRNVLLHIKSSINEINEKPFNAIFLGPTGTGKSFLSHCIAAELIKKNKSVLYVNVNEYLNSMKPDYTGENLEQYAIASDMFIIDDLGTENYSEFTSSKLNYIIDKRLVDNKSTILSTNHSIVELQKKYLESMVSRIAHIYIKYILIGEDLRRRKYANI